MNNRLLSSHRNRNKIKNITRIKEETATPVNMVDIIINTQKVKPNNTDIKAKLAAMEKDYDKTNLKSYWDKRTNDPYKVIFKKENFKKDYKTQDDLVVHRVTSKDKEGVEEEYNHKTKDILTHNNELKKIYAKEKEESHFKKFVYNNSYKYRTPQTKPTDFVEMKDAAKHEDDNNDDVPDIMDSLIESGLLDLGKKEDDDAKNKETEQSKSGTEDSKDTLVPVIRSSAAAKPEKTVKVVTTNLNVAKQLDKTKQARPNSDSDTDNNVNARVTKNNMNCFSVTSAQKNVEISGVKIIKRK